MKDLSVLLLLLAGHHHHCHPLTRYQMSYVCVLEFQLSRSDVMMILKKLACGVEDFLDIWVSPTTKKQKHFNKNIY